MKYRGLIQRYREFLPTDPSDKIVSLNEGNTPLIPALRLGERLGGIELYLKFEGSNPTGSFKDRGMTMAVTKALSSGAKAIICASTGNTSASAAAYGARAGLKCFVVIPDGKIALGKLAQALVHGARVICIDGNFDQGLEMVRRISESHREIALVNSVNPYRLEGQTTAAYEVCDELGRAPDILAIPVGNAGNISAYWMGFKRYRQAGRISNLPRMWGFQAAGAAPLVRGAPVDNPETIATAIRIGRPASWELAVKAAGDSGGFFDAVTDDEILAAYDILAQEEGVFCEPASAASVAGLIKASAAKSLSPGTKVVAVLTGQGLKDPERATARTPDLTKVPAKAEALEEILGVSRGQG